MALLWATVGMAAGTALLLACSASPDDGASARSGVRGAPDPAPPVRLAVARDPLPPCGDGPHVDLAIWLFELRADGAAGVLAGATATFDVCPAYSVVTDEFGMATARVPRGVPLIARLDAPNHITSIISQNVLDQDSQLDAFVPTRAASDLLPGYGAGASVLGVYLDAIGAGACAHEDGVTLHVVGHPEVEAIYMRADWPRDRAPSTATSSAGPIVFFTGLGEGTVEIEGSKPGCAIQITGPSEQTGRFPLVRGAWTVGAAFVAD